MPKKIIRDVVLDRAGQVKSEMLDDDKTKPQFLSRKKVAHPNSYATGHKHKKYIWYAVILVVIIFLFILFTHIFASALIKVTPLTESLPVDGAVTIYRDGEGEVTPSYKVIEVSGSEAGQAVASGTKNVERKASGHIVIFNEYTKSAVKFIKNTRFESPAGKIYKILNPVSIPGYKVVSGKTIPGSIEVEVFAENPGADYNTGLVDFKIPGLKNTPEYTKVYAKSKTPMTGGFTGKIFEVSDTDRENVTKELQTKLEKTLTDKLAGEIPPGYILLSDATTIKMDEVNEDLPDNSAGSATTSSDDRTVNYNQTGKIYGVILDVKEFSQSIADRYLEAGKFDTANVLVNNPNDLIFDVLDSKTFDPSTSTSISLNVSGTANLVWQFNQQKLKSDLRGLPKGDYKKVLAKYGSIKSATISMTPPWIRSFPTKIEKIKVEIESK